MLHKLLKEARMPLKPLKPSKQARNQRKQEQRQPKPQAKPARQPLLAHQRFGH